MLLVLFRDNVKTYGTSKANTFTCLAWAFLPHTVLGNHEAFIL